MQRSQKWYSELHRKQKYWMLGCVCPVSTLPSHPSAFKNISASFAGHIISGMESFSNTIYNCTFRQPRFQILLLLLVVWALFYLRYVQTYEVTSQPSFCNVTVLWAVPQNCGKGTLEKSQCGHAETTPVGFSSSKLTMLRKIRSKPIDPLWWQEF